MNIDNYITTDGNIFQSKININNSERFEIKTDGYNIRKNFYELVKIQNDECIFFYVYDNSSNLEDTIYYTKGSIFTFENGIGSSKKIDEITKDDIHDEKIKNIILKFNFFDEYIQKPPVPKEDIVSIKEPVPKQQPVPTQPVSKEPVPKQPVSKEPVPKQPVSKQSLSKEPVRKEPVPKQSVSKEPVPKQSVSKEPVPTQPVSKEPVPKQTKAQQMRNQAIQNQIKNPKLLDQSTSITRYRGGSVINADIINLLNEKCKNINILYANTILPEKLYNVLNKLGKQQLEWLTTMKSIVKHLYINISAPNDLSNIKAYNELYQEFYSYYSSINIDLYKYNNELKKERKEFAGLKINEYFKFMNGKNDNTGKPRFYDDSSFIIHIFDFADFLLSNNNLSDELVGVINTILNNSLIKLDVNINNINIIKQEIENGTQKMYTYLQIKNFEHNNNSNFLQPHNERYNIKLDKKKRSMVMEYYDTTLAFYDENKKYILNGEKLEKERPDNFKVKRKNETILNEIEKITYDSKFIFGNFNKIFSPGISTKEIAGDLKNLIDKVKEGKPLFLMGWGTSGSGKTSSLISLNENGIITPGVIIYLCNELCNVSCNDSDITIELVCQEIFEPYYLVNNEMYKVNNDKKSVSIKSGPIIFNFTRKEEDSKKIKLSNSYTHTAKHPYKLTTNNWKKQNTENEKKFEIGTPLGDIMQHLIDKDRLVKATPNNPNSSRSHILCFLKFNLCNKSNKEKKTHNIIFGDLAGVENRFNCNDTFEIGNFLSVKKQGTTQTFYQNEIDSGFNFDPVFGGGNPHKFSDETEKNKFIGLMNKPFFNFNNRDILIDLYKFTSINKTGIKYFVNEILNQVFTDIITTENLNENILKNGIKLKEKITNYKNNNENFNFNYEIAQKMMPIMYGSTNYSETIKKIIDEYVKKDIQKEKAEKYKRPNAFVTQKEIEKYPHRKKIEDKEKEKVFYKLWTKSNIEILLDKIEECIAYSQIIQGACEHRKTEGVFINKSLIELIEDMVNIINKKNQNTVYYIPSIVDKCIKTYCPTQNKCFSITHSEERPIELNSLIIQTIYEQLKANINEEDSEQFTNDTFANDIELCIFGVFNWSRSANNPPPAPYVDINIFKQMIFEQDKKMLKEDNFIQALTSKIDELTKNKISSYALNKLIKIKEALTAKNENYYEIMLDNLNDINNANAITAIGTIEFIDSIAKLNSISNSCFNPSIDSNEYMDIYRNIKK
jgi:hypothetical protein